MLEIILTDSEFSSIALTSLFRVQDLWSLLHS